MTDNNETPYWNSKLDQRIGTMLETWTTRDTGAYCRFCADERVGDVDEQDKFCSSKCRERFDQVLEARVAIGSRDMDQRGYD